MAHLHNVRDDDKHFSIDPYYREITYLSEDPLVISQIDHNSEVYTFTMPRYVEGHDMMDCNKIQVHYINISSESRTKRSIGMYEVEDLQISPDDENSVIFTWLISQNATMFIGSLSFTIRFACMTGSKIDYSWATTVFDSVEIVESLNNTEFIATQYPDVLEEWYLQLIASGTMGVNIVDEAKNNALDEINKAESNRIKELTDEALSRIDAKEVDIVEAVLTRLPVYDGETEDVT